MVTDEGVPFIMNNKLFKNIGNQTTNDPSYSYREIEEISKRNEHVIIYYSTKKEKQNPQKCFIMIKN